MATQPGAGCWPQPRPQPQLQTRSHSAATAVATTTTTTAPTAVSCGATAVAGLCRHRLHCRHCPAEASTSGGSWGSCRAANRCVLSEIARRAESLACVVLRALDEPDVTAWLVELVRQDLTTSKSIQEKHCQWQNRLRSLWLALPRDTRPPATGGREAHATCISVCQHDLTTREGQAADLFKDLLVPSPAATGC